MKKINPRTERLVKTPEGLTRIEGSELIGDRLYTWMRYVSGKDLLK